MAFTKINFYLTIILIVGILGTLIMTVGQDLLIDPNYNLDDKSIAYISQYSGLYSSQGIVNISDQNSKTLKENKIILLDNETGESITSNQLAELDYHRKKYYGIVNYMKLVYNFPTFLIGALGIPLYGFSYILNTIALVLYLGVAIMMWRLLRGG